MQSGRPMRASLSGVRATLAGVRLVWKRPEAARATRQRRRERTAARACDGWKAAPGPLRRDRRLLTGARRKRAWA